MIEDLFGENWHLFEVLNQRAGHTPFLDPLMIVAANDLIVLLPILMLVLWSALAHWSPLLRGRGRRGRVGGTSERGAGGWERAADARARGLGQRMALLGCLAVGIALALNVVLGHLVDEPRPFISHPTAVHQLIAHGADDAFPSDHTAVASAIASVFVLYLLFLVVPPLLRLLRLWPSAMAGRLSRGARESRGSWSLARTWMTGAQARLVVLAALLALVAVLSTALIGVSRVYTGLHYPGDILGGAVCGTLGGIAAVALRPVSEPLLTLVMRLAERLHLA